MRLDSMANRAIANSLMNLPTIPSAMIRTYSPKHGPGQMDSAEQWMVRFQGKRPVFACILGFTETALIPGISAAGATPQDRRTTALADAEFLYSGPQTHPTYPLPPLTVGVSPAFITRAVIQSQSLPMYVFNAGLLETPTIPHIDLQGDIARCVSTGQALTNKTVNHLFQMGLQWGDRLAQDVPNSYLILGECVVGGTTTALSVLTGLGWPAMGKVNSSHPACNHQQKQEIVIAGLRKLGPCHRSKKSNYHPGKIIAAVGDPMQPVVAGMAIAASKTCGVLLAGGTQMLAIYALIKDWTMWDSLPWDPKNIVVGTTQWVANDPTGDTLGLAHELQSPFLVTQLKFQTSKYPQLKKYEEGFVKEGVGAGGCAISASLYQNWTNDQIVEAIEHLLGDYQRHSKLL